MFFWSIISYLLVSHFLIETGEVVGESMSPTLSNGDQYVINHAVLFWSEPQPGDIVAVRFHGDEDLSVKRVIAGPGQTVRIDRGGVFVDGEALEEPYLSPTVCSIAGRDSTNVVRIKPGHYYVLGDNRNVSLDSRDFGPVPLKAICGKINTQEAWRLSTRYAAARTKQK